MNALPSLRGDLNVTCREDGNRLVADPISGTYFLFSPEEWSLAALLSQSDSLEHWVENWNTNDRRQSLQTATAERFLGRLIQDQLVHVPWSGYGLRLHMIESRQSGLANSFKNPLSVRFPGCDPTPVLRILSPVVGYFFHPAVMACVAIFLTLIAGAVMMTTERFPELSSLQWLTTPQGIFAFVCVFVFVKVVHELGHAIAANANQASCRQIGVLMLFFLPTLYCDVSDAWRLENRWRRIAISAAGIYVEFVLALLAAIGWTLTAPGPLNGILFQIMLMCSVSTLLINGNPLLRYDGYYVLSDLLGQPNLTAAAKLEWQKLTADYFSWHTIKSTRWGLVTFRACSFAYQLFVIASIVLTIICVTTEYSLGSVGWGIAAVLAAFFARALYFKSTTAETGSAARSRMAAAIVLAAIVWFAICIPLPRWVYLEFKVHPLNTHTIYATMDGSLQPTFEEDATVPAHSPLLTIANPELESKVETAEVEFRRSANEVAQLTRRCRIQPELIELLGVANQQKLAAIARRENLRKQLSELTLTSSISGRVESLLESRNPASPSRAQVFRGQPIARVVDETKKQIRLLVSENDVDLLQPGQEVFFRPDCCNDRPDRGTLGKLMLGQWKQNGKQNGKQNEIGAAEAKSASGQSQTVSKVFVATVETGSNLENIQVYSTGSARVRIASATIAQQLSSLLRQTFQYR